MRKLLLMLIIIMWCGSAWGVNYVSVYDDDCTTLRAHYTSAGTCLFDALYDATTVDGDCVVINQDLTGAAIQITVQPEVIDNNIKIKSAGSNTFTVASTGSRNTLYSDNVSFSVENVNFVGSPTGNAGKANVVIVATTTDSTVSFTNCSFTYPESPAASYRNIAAISTTNNINLNLTNCSITTPAGAFTSNVGISHAASGIVNISNCYFDNTNFKAGKAITSAGHADRPTTLTVSNSYFYVKQTNVTTPAANYSTAINITNSNLSSYALITNNIISLDVVATDDTFHKYPNVGIGQLYGTRMDIIGNLIFGNPDSLGFNQGIFWQIASGTDTVYNNTFVNISKPFFARGNGVDTPTDYGTSIFKNNLFFNCAYLVSAADGAITADGDYIFSSVATFPQEESDMPPHANVSNNIHYTAGGAAGFSDADLTSGTWSADEVTESEAAAATWNTDPALNGTTIITQFPDSGSTAYAKTGGVDLGTAVAATTRLISRQARSNSDLALQNISTIDHEGHGGLTYPIGAYSYGMFDYYVSDDATGNPAGIDTNAGTQANPWKTLANVNIADNYDPAYAVNVYLDKADTWAETLTVPTSGAASYPITYTSYGTGAKPIIDGRESIATWTNTAGNVYEAACDWVATQLFETGTRRTYKVWNTNIATTDLAQGEWTLDTTGNKVYVWCSDDADPDTHTMTITHRTDGINVNNKSYITIDGLRFSEIAYRGVYIGDLAGDNSQNVIVQNCYFDYIGNANVVAAGTDTAALYVFNGAKNLQALSNTFINNSCDSMYVAHDDAAGENAVISYNTSSYYRGQTNCGDNLHVNGLETCTISHNTLSKENDVIYPTGNANKGNVMLIGTTDAVVEYNKLSYGQWGVYLEAFPADTIIRYNYIDNHGTGYTTPSTDKPSGIKLWKLDGATIYGNILADDYYSMEGIIGTDLDNINIYNNTFIRPVVNGVKLSKFDGEFKNNIMWGTVVPTERWFGITSLSSTGGSSLVVNNNSYYPATGNQWRDKDGNYAWAAWQAIPQDANGIITDPKLALPNLWLKMGSPCLKAGATLASPYDYGLSKSSTWPSSVVLKKQDSKFTIGAYAMKKSCIPGSRVLCTVK